MACTAIGRFTPGEQGFDESLASGRRQSPYVPRIVPDLASFLRTLRPNAFGRGVPRVGREH